MKPSNSAGLRFDKETLVTDMMPTRVFGLGEIEKSNSA